MDIKEEYKIMFKKLRLRIKELREEKGLSLEELAHKSGIRKEYLQKIEQGKAYQMKLCRHANAIAKVLNKKVYDLFDF